MYRRGTRAATAGLLALLLAACGTRSDAPPGATEGTASGGGAMVADPPPPASGDLAAYVDPFIGSFPPGFVNPGPFAPFGMVQPGPDTEGPLNYGGYSVQNLLVTGFSQIHMSAGAPKGGQFPLLPFTGELTPGDLSQLGWPNPVPAYASPLNPLDHRAEVGYYRVGLLRYGVTAEITASERVAMHRYRYGRGAPRLLLDVSRDLAGYHPARAQLEPDGLLSGSVDSSDGYTVYFALRLDAPFRASTRGGEELQPGVAVEGEDLALLLDFDDAPSVVQAMIAVSFTDLAGARRNLAELEGRDFDAQRERLRTQWQGELARVEVEGGSNDQRKSFYTALYRIQQFPNLHSDVDGRYRGPDNAVHAGARPHYSQYSLWDSYRGQNQMLAEIQPTRYRDMLRSLLDFSKQGGRLPRWQQGPVDASHMSGDPVIPFIGEGWCRGLVPAAERAPLLAAMQALEQSRREALATGYLPVEKPANPLAVLSGGPREAGTTLEYGIADFALALMTASSGDAAEAQRLAQQSLNYRNLIDEQSGFIRPRHEDGSWLTPFLPELGYGFQEGTSWQYSWLAMHDLPGLVERMGGQAAVQARLDTFFLLPANLAPGLWPLLQSQITLFGLAYYGNQYAPGNEHDVQAPYVYNYAGAPWKTQIVARSAAALFAPTPLGLPGNDDLGAMSGWLAWTLIGLYPMNPGAPLAVVGSPAFEKVTLHRPGGDLVIEAPGAGPLRPFVNGLSLDGQALEGSWLLLPRGAATVRMDTAMLPDADWASESTPPSLSDSGLEAFGCVP
ncbi:GH92 family glycosyl hydrolase [Solimonas sp. K1W22B-7]|uniref:GH92 family glycosyl hydrolase n=1 Tax=Solimonas sp. K1W22B-7 TaxID=2303331 RepID=UPI0013C53831|nr:GH92 family glycosyl hydrolase [Solimonas sp. K1W22B-7]